MAQTTLALLTHPGFPQVLESIIGREFERVERILAQHQLSPCSHESPESSRGACDGGEPCSDTATVHDLETEQEFCLKHFGARQ